jgi:hypothetical protein
VTEENGRIHNQVAELLSAYIDDEVTTDERALVEEHLATCASCVYDLATLRQTVALLVQLPQVAAPRPFTLRVSDVMPLRPARPAWWRLPWVQGVVAAAAVLLCVVAVSGVLLLGPIGRSGAPAAPAPVALQAPAPTGVARGEVAEEAEAIVVEKEVELEAEKMIEAPASAPPTSAAYSEEEGAREPAPVREAPAEADQANGEVAPGKAEPPPAAAPPSQATASPPVMASGVVAPTPTVEIALEAEQRVAEEAAPAEATPAPVGTPVPAPEALGAAAAWLEVENLTIKVEPGVVRVSGRLPLPEGRRLAAELWRDGGPTGWAMPEGEPATVGVDGQFSLLLQARPAAPDFDLFAIEPASYEIRIRPIDPPGPEEARVPFDTYGPPPPEPAEPSKVEPPADEGQTAPTSGPTPTNVPTAVPTPEEEVPPAAATSAVVAPRSTTLLLVGLLGIGVVALLLAGLAAVFFFRARR